MVPWLLSYWMVHVKLKPFMIHKQGSCMNIVDTVLGPGTRDWTESIRTLVSTVSTGVIGEQTENRTFLS